MYEAEHQRFTYQSPVNVVHGVLNHARLKNRGAGLDTPPVHLPDPVVDVRGRVYVNSVVEVDSARVQGGHVDVGLERHVAISCTESREAARGALDDDVSLLPNQGEGAPECSQVPVWVPLLIQRLEVGDGRARPPALTTSSAVRSGVRGRSGQAPSWACGASGATVMMTWSTAPS
jgi:hypothetical protein